MIQTISETKSNALINNEINQIINLINVGNFQDALLIGQSLEEVSGNNPDVLSIMGMLNEKLGSQPEVYLELNLEREGVMEDFSIE